MTELLARRAHMSEPGEPLFLPRDPVQLMTNFGVFGRDTKLPGRNLRVSACVSVPMVESGFRYTYSSVNPEMMYHPLLWVPERLSMKPDEGLDHWMIRVALEYASTGAYNQIDGTWYDVMAHLGISVDTPDGIERIQRWINGGEDKELSSFNFDELLLANNEDDPDWSYEAATQMQPDLQVASIHYIATALSQMVAEAVDVDDDFFTEHPEERPYAASLASRAASAFLDVVEPDYNIDFLELSRHIETMGPDEVTDTAGLVDNLRLALSEIADDSAEAEDRLNSSFSEVFGSDNPSAEDIEAALGDEEDAQDEAGEHSVNEPRLAD